MARCVSTKSQTAIGIPRTYACNLILCRGLRCIAQIIVDFAKVRTRKTNNFLEYSIHLITHLFEGKSLMLYMLVCITCILLPTKYTRQLHQLYNQQLSRQQKRHMYQQQKLYQRQGRQLPCQLAQ